MLTIDGEASGGARQLRLKSSLRRLAKRLMLLLLRPTKNPANMITDAEEAASKRAEDMIADASRTMEADIVKARAELRKEMLNLVTAATETVLDEKVDSKKDGQLIEKALAGVKSE
jgi:phosphoglucomutase